MAVKGSPEQLQAVLARQQADARDKTLGTLIRKFTDRHLICETPKNATQLNDTGVAGQCADVAWLSMRFNISMSRDLYVETIEGLAALVDMRNDLVHHLVERFDVSSESGCQAASNYLDDCYNKIDGHWEDLNGWINSLAQTQALASEFFHSKSFEDAVLHGINPDGTVCWGRSTIVECLRNAEEACKIDGWTSLDAAIEFISKANRDQTPSRYGCKTWRKVLRKSGLFEIRCAAISDVEVGKTWYRSSSHVVAS